MDKLVCPWMFNFDTFVKSQKLANLSFPRSLSSTPIGERESSNFFVLFLSKMYAIAYDCAPAY